jgi:hypothetical protein
MTPANSRLIAEADLAISVSIHNRAASQRIFAPLRGAMPPCRDFRQPLPPALPLPAAEARDVRRTMRRYERAIDKTFSHT